MAKWLYAFTLSLLLGTAVCAQGVVNDKPISLGTLENGVFHHNLTGVQFTLPPDWVIVSQQVATGGAQVVMLRDTTTNIVASVWLKPRVIDPANTPAMLDRRLDMKTAQRNNFQAYKFRAESVQHTTIGGQPALSAVADYVRTGQRMIEAITWIDGEKSRINISARMPESEWANFEPRLNSVVQTAVVP